MQPEEVANKLTDYFSNEAPDLAAKDQSFLFDFIDDSKDIEGYVGWVHGKNEEDEEQLFVVFESEAAALQYAFGDLHTGHFQEGDMALAARERAMQAVNDGGCKMAERVETLEKMYCFLDQQREKLKPETFSSQVQNVCDGGLDNSDQLYKKLGRYVNLVRAKSDEVCAAFVEMNNIDDVGALDQFLADETRCQDCQAQFRDQVIEANLPVAA